MRKELEEDQARNEEQEHAELEKSEDDPCSMRPRERVDERPVELILDALRRMPVVVKELLLAGVEHEPADHEIDAQQRRPVGGAVEERSAPDDCKGSVVRLVCHRCPFRRGVDVTPPRRRFDVTERRPASTHRRDGCGGALRPTTPGTGSRSQRGERRRRRSPTPTRAPTRRHDVRGPRSARRSRR